MARTGRSVKYRRQKNSKSLYKKLYLKQRSYAKARGIAWDLSLEFWNKLVRQPCYLCNTRPMNVYTRFRPDRPSQHGLKFIYQGLDRLRNDIGYTEENTYPCCITCNKIKLDKSLSSLSKHLEKIQNHSNIVDDLRSFIKSLKDRNKNEVA